MHDVKWK